MTAPQAEAEEDEFQSSVILLQRLLRGRAMQNRFYEGKLRRKDLISELQRVEAEREKNELAEENVAEQARLTTEKRDTALKKSTLDAVAGGTLRVCRERERLCV
jgi:hypothetical protein